MSICSLALLPELERLPTGVGAWDRDLAGLAQQLACTDGELWSVEMAVGAEEAMAALFEWRNVPDDLLTAYEAAFTSSAAGLHEHYLQMLESGDRAALGFVSNLKGKLAEMRLVPELEKEFPGYRFEIAQKANQPVWDIQGIAPAGAEDIFVQVKAGSAGDAGEVAERMQESPETLFAVSSEIRQQILSAHPELAGQVVAPDFSGIELTEDVEEGLLLLQENYGIDLPDSIGDVLQCVDEIVIGVRIALDWRYVQREFVDANPDDRQRVHGLKGLLLVARVAVSGGLVTTGAAIGSLVPGFGNAVGALLGAGTAGVANRRLQPHALRLAMVVMGITDDDLFYFRHKRRVDRVALSFAETRSI